MIVRALVAAGVLAVAVSLGSVHGARASFPGANGKIVFVSNRAGGANDIYTMNPDGTARVNLTRHAADYRGPRWSADGREIVFASDRNGDGLQIFTMTADGGDVHELTTSLAPPNVQPSFTSGGQIVFTHGSFPNRTIYLMNADGSNPHNLTTGTGDNAWPAPAPTGPSVAFSRIDGTGGGQRLMLLNLSSGQVKPVTNPVALDDAEANWSPTGNDLVFARSGDTDSDLYLVHRDGSGLRQLTSSPTRVDTRPAFSPDGTQIVFSGCTGFGTPDQRCGLYTMPTAGGNPTDISTIKAPYVDTFSGDLLDPFWSIQSQGSGIDVTQTNGELQFHLGPATTVGPDGFVDVGAFTACRLPGAFDVQVDYRLVSGPLPPGVNQDFQAVEFTGGAFTGTHGMFVFNPGFGSPGVSTNFPGGQNAFAPDTSLSGTLRLVESVGPTGRTVTAYRKVGDGFVELATSAPFSVDESALILDVFSNLSPFPYPSVTVAYDNFRISSGDISCPSWWDDDFPDWQAVAPAD